MKNSAENLPLMFQHTFLIQKWEKGLFLESSEKQEKWEETYVCSDKEVQSFNKWYFKKNKKLTGQTQKNIWDNAEKITTKGQEVVF